MVRKATRKTLSKMSRSQLEKRIDNLRKERTNVARKMHRGKKPYLAKVRDPSKSFKKLQQRYGLTTEEIGKTQYALRRKK